jgi:HPt (histidine-containing phosphotransfer) domain-containing protein
MRRNLIDQPLFDVAQIALLRDALGQEDLHVMFSELPRAVEQACHELRTALASNDLEEVRRQAHALKGVTSSFGAARLAAIAGEFEFEATSIAWVMQRMPALADAIEETSAALADVDAPHRQA